MDVSTTRIDERAAESIRALASYASPSVRSGVWQLVNSFVPFVVLWAAMLFSLEYSYLLTLALAFPAAGLFVRLFIIQHDCGHGSFFPSRRANNTLGFWLGILTLVPYDYWRRTHAIHHATSGDLGRRGFGDVDTKTVQEYLALSRRQRFAYRLGRNAFVLFGWKLPRWQFRRRSPATWSSRRCTRTTHPRRLPGYWISAYRHS